MKRINRRSLVIGGAVLAIAAGGTGAAVAVGGGDEGESQAKGPGADKAREKALSMFPGGKANAVERDSEDGATWEVEVTRSDGKTVDVRLDSAYDVVVVEGDSESEDESKQEESNR